MKGFGINLFLNADKIIADSKKISDALKGIKKDGDETGTGVERSFTNIGSVIAKSTAIVYGLNKAWDIIKSSINNAREFEKAITEINSVLGVNERVTNATTRAIKDLARAYGTDAQTQAKAFYTIVSSGTEDQATATEILKAANLAALGAQADVNDVARVLTATLNAYAGTGLDAARATDILVKSVDDGAVNFSELTQQLARATPSAAALKIPLEELAGTIAFLTRQGFTTEQAVTSIASALTTIVTPAEESIKTLGRLNEKQKTNIQLGSDAVKAAGGFQQYIEKLVTAAGGSADILTQIFGDQRAAKAILAINSQTDQFSETLTKVADSAGAAQIAADKMKESFDFKVKQLDSEWKDFTITLGDTFLPVLSSIIGGFNSLFRLLGRNPVTELDTQFDQLNQSIVKNGYALEALEKQIKMADEAGNLTEVNRLTEEKNKLLERTQGFQTAQVGLQALQDEQNKLKEINDNLKEKQKLQEDATKVQSGGIVDMITSPRLAGVDTRENLKEINALEAERKASLERIAYWETEIANRTKATVDVKAEEVKPKPAPVVLETEEQAAARIAAEQQYNDELLKMSQDVDKVILESKLQRYVVEGEAARTKNEELTNAEKEHFEGLLEVYSEQDAIKLEMLNQKILAEQDLTKQQLLQEEYNAQASLMITKKKLDQEVKWEQMTTKQKVQMAQQTLGFISGLMSSSSAEAFEIGKAASIANATISGIEASINAYKFGAGIGGPITGGIFAAMAAAATAVQIQQIANTPRPKFRTGGVVGGFGGASSGPDNVMAEVRNGEMFLPAKQQYDLWNMLNGGMSSMPVLDLLAENNQILQSKNFQVDINGKTLNEETDRLRNARLE